MMLDFIYSFFCQVYDGADKNATLLGQFYEDKPFPRLLTSSGNRLYLVFVSDNRDDHGFGFNITYQRKGRIYSNDTFRMRKKKLLRIFQRITYVQQPGWPGFGFNITYQQKGRILVMILLEWEKKWLRIFQRTTCIEQLLW